MILMGKANWPCRTGWTEWSPPSASRGEFFEDADATPGQEPDLLKTGTVAGGGGDSS
jgi:hypothetical protein